MYFSDASDTEEEHCVEEDATFKDAIPDAKNIKIGSTPVAKAVSPGM